MKAIAVIPARLASVRLPRKMLREIAGKPLIGVVYEAVRSSPLLAEVFIATDSEEIVGVCREHGWNAQMTSPAHRSGTERVHELSARETAEVYINVQGDEPLTRPEHIATLLQVMQNPAAQVGTLMTPAAAVDIPNPNAVKVVTDLSGRALYFSRATIPFDREKLRGLIAGQPQPRRLHYSVRFGADRHGQAVLAQALALRPLFQQRQRSLARILRSHRNLRPCQITSHSPVYSCGSTSGFLLFSLGIFGNTP